MSVICLVVVSGCAAPDLKIIEPTMTNIQAMSYCRGQIDEASRTKTNVGVGIGVGSGGKVSTKSGISIGFDVSSDASKDKRYQSCVLEKSDTAASDVY